MQTPGLNHVILTVSNTERSHAFYGDLLGFPSSLLKKIPIKVFYLHAEGFNSFSFHRVSLFQMTVSLNFGLAWIICPLQRRVKKHCRN
jgi:hypothetical protein